MREVFDQAHGLHAYASLAFVTRFIAVPAMVQGGVSHRLLWLLARRFSLQGEPVCVIDGMADEAPGQDLLARLNVSDAAPGANANVRAAYLVDEAAPGVCILPGRQGLLRLANQAHGAGAQGAWQRLVAAVPAGSHVLLTAPADLLAVCLQGTAARPLVALDGQPRSVVEAYNAVKVLLQVGDLHPLLVPMALGGVRSHGHAQALTQALEAPVQALARCAQAHLGEDLQIWPVAYDESRDSPADRVPESWWLKVVDSAIAVPQSPHLAMWGPTTSVDTTLEHRSS
ncbi:MAG: hypothetical protein Q8S02_18265 [Hydrogenophaga sp.]|nr:hypothetical protein [Hydrogenophaga sp.]